jgi:hypothetical protein
MSPAPEGNAHRCGGDWYNSDDRWKVLTLEGGIVVRWRRRLTRRMAEEEAKTVRSASLEKQRDNGVTETDR